MKLNFEQATIEKAAHEAAVAEASAALERFPRGPMGLTPDVVRATSEYRSAKRAYDIAFREMQKFNVFYTKAFKAEYAALRKRTRVAK